ncbi:cation:proton antiporter [Candidatus Woesearchaeota archaeon]|nr:cation:proton antiporter [Candidatus Woesearchaeota archaeon]
MTLLMTILICLVVAYLFSAFFRFIGLPRVIGQIIAGLVLGIPVISSYLFNPQSLDVLSFLANLGIILLFYYVGLETDFRAFTQNVKKSISISLFNTMTPFLIGFFVMKFFLGFDTVASIITGVALSVSAQSISVDLLEELKILKTRLGNLIVSAGAVDDMIELVLVSVLLSFLHLAISNLTLFRLVFDIVLFLLLIIFARFVVIPSTMKFFDLEHSASARFMGSLIIVLFIASLSELLNVGALIGAMVAGMIIRQTIKKEVSIPDWEQADISRSIHTIAFGFLIPLFFVWIGVKTDVTQILPNLGFIFLLFAIATVGTVGGSIIAVMLAKGSFREGLILGFGLNPKGDLELVIIALALQSSLITPQLFAVIVVMSLLTTFVSPIVFKRLLINHKRTKA